MTNNKNAGTGVNAYGRELTDEEIARKVHRDFVGGLWDELGELQSEFLKEQGLKPFHKLADIGCGCLRGGIHFLRYLEPGNYYGLDINKSLIDAGLQEIRGAGLEGKRPNLLSDDRFRLGSYGARFDFMISASLFTHLPMNSIIRCLSAAALHLNADGRYFSTFFQAPTSVHLDDIVQVPDRITSKYDSDPFHYSFEEMSWMGSLAGLNAELIGDWGHPRNQKMVVFYHS